MTPVRGIVGTVIPEDSWWYIKTLSKNSQSFSLFLYKAYIFKWWLNSSLYGTLFALDLLWTILIYFCNNFVFIIRNGELRLYYTVYICVLVSKLGVRVDRLNFTVRMSNYPQWSPKGQGIFPLYRRDKMLKTHKIMSEFGTLDND